MIEKGNNAVNSPCLLSRATNKNVVGHMILSLFSFTSCQYLNILLPT